eukprot:RCo017743
MLCTANQTKVGSTNHGQAWDSTKNPVFSIDKPQLIRSPNLTQTHAHSPSRTSAFFSCFNGENGEKRLVLCPIPSQRTQKTHLRGKYLEKEKKALRVCDASSPSK